MSDQYIGEVRPFAGNFAPLGWALCDGSLLSIQDNQALFSLIGTTYGGNGETNFGLPDLRGRAAIHQGTGAGLSPYAIGQQFGSETVTVSTAQMPGHPHSFAGTNAGATTATPSPAVILASAPTEFPIYDGTASPVALSAQAVTTAGGSVPHNNRQPFLAITYIIALDGIYPSRS